MPGRSGSSQGACIKLRASYRDSRKPFTSASPALARSFSSPHLLTVVHRNRLLDLPSGKASPSKHVLMPRRQVVLQRVSEEVRKITSGHKMFLLKEHRVFSMGTLWSSPICDHNYETRPSVHSVGSEEHGSSIKRRTWQRWKLPMGDSQPRHSPLNKGSQQQSQLALGHSTGVFTCLSQLFVREIILQICKVCLLSYSLRQGSSAQLSRKSKCVWPQRRSYSLENLGKIRSQNFKYSE